MLVVTPDLFGTPAAEKLIADLLFGKNPQPRQLTDRERAVLKQLKWHAGERLAITITDLAGKLSLNPREIKDAVRSLIVEFSLPIAGSRQKPFGYYMATTPEELQAASRPLEGEVFSMLQRIRSLRGPAYIEDLAKRLVDRLNAPPPAELANEQEASE